MPASIG